LTFFFVPPVFEFLGFAPENAITFFGLLVVSIIMSTLVARERSLARSAQRRAEQVTQLYEFSRDLSTAVDMLSVLDTIIHHVRRTFDREMIVLLPKNDELVLSASSNDDTLDSSEVTAAEWAYQQGRPAGYQTGTFSYASYRYFPLETSRGIIGVMGVRLSGEKPELHAEQVRLLSTYVTKAASSVERALLAEEASQSEILRATEKLQTALLNSISHDLRTPLASVTGVLSSLRMDDDFLDTETRRELVETALGEAERLNRLVGNLLDMTRLESGAMRLSLQPCDIQDVIGSALNSLGQRIEGHQVQVEIPPSLPLVPLDYVLVAQVMINLLDNAAKYSPESGQIEIQAFQSETMITVEVADQGPGIPEEDLRRIFEKFYRVKRFENVVGTGLGLSICKGIIEVHGGKIWAENRPDGGLKIAFTLPLKPSTLVVQEPAVHELHEEIQHER
jgi:two-component system, OmpR family, sensor histidine kinase KdpD